MQGKSDPQISKHRIDAAALFIIEYALAKTLENKLGIKPDYLIGHSMGNIQLLFFQVF